VDIQCSLLVEDIHNSLQVYGQVLQAVDIQVAESEDIQVAESADILDFQQVSTQNLP
jgi:hypothetical protein